MNDSGWRDPFENEEPARERERRRTERAARRRSENDDTRQSLAERVRDQLGGSEGPPSDPDATPSPDASARAGRGVGPPPEGAVEQPPAPPMPPAPETRPRPEVAAPAEWPRARSGRAGGRDPATIRRHRIIGLLGVLALVAAVALAGYAISKRGGNAPPPAAPVKPRKTESVTIPEGYTRVQMAAVAKKANLKGSYVKASESSKKIDLAKYGAKGSKNLEGFLFPATYELFKGATAQDLVDKQVEAFQQNLDGINMPYAKSKNLSPYDVTIIASMIEREIQAPSERKLAASVIYNRLKQGTPLGIDATIRYEDNNFTKPLLESRLQQDTPYNTRINTGLPPGPIGNPGLASLEAAANPAKTNYFFYVVKPGTCGKHVFVKTQAEFDQATAAYNNARAAAGGNSPTTC